MGKPKGKRKPVKRKSKGVKLGGDWQTCWFVLAVIVGPPAAVGAVAVWRIAEAVS